jgi:hypothetical protein
VFISLALDEPAMGFPIATRISELDGVGVGVAVGVAVGVGVGTGVGVGVAEGLKAM